MAQSTRTIEKYEIWDFSSSVPRFLHSDVYICYSNEIRMLEVTAREDAISDEAIDATLAETIPPDQLWPLPQEHMRQYTGDFSDVYVKGPNLSNFVMLRDTTQNPADLLLHEARIHEEYFKDPHPNIGRYLGYRLGVDGRLRGLCFKRYTETLRGRLDLGHPIDMTRLKKDLQTGITFIHECGLVHNDLNPANVMFDEHETAVIIDYDSCRRKGERLGAKPGVDHSRQFAEYENDWNALHELERDLSSFSGTENGARSPLESCFAASTER